MRDITEQEVMQHAVSDNLILWKQIHHLITAVNEFNQRKDDHRYHALAGKVEAISIGMEAFLNASAKAVLNQKIEQIRANKRAELAFDNVALNSLDIPKFGASHV